MNPEQIFTHLKKLASSLTAKQILGLVTVFVAVVGVVGGSAYWLSIPNYTLLVADMDAETASSVVGRLKDANVPYELADGGRTVRVPSERADELRLEFASGGLPSAGRIGFEIFDRPAFGTTEFLEHVNYRRALEGELARTVSTLSEVASARVHIAMAKDSLFVDQAQPAKASVVLRLKANRPLAPATVRGIASLVSGSVESLRPESVIILDTFGRSLTRSTEDSEAGATGGPFDRQQQLERDLSSKVVALLEPVVGTGRVRVNVAAYFKTETVEQTEERWDPAAVVRSSQKSSETGAGGVLGAGGVAGARANQPPALSTAPAAVTATAPPAGATPPGTTPGAPATGAPSTAVAVAAQTGPGRTSETTNYEIGRLTRHTVSPQGQLARLSVAVILDDEHVPAATAGAGQAPAGGAPATPAAATKPWDQQAIQRFQGLVAAAVGLDTARGDQLTVENIAFEAPQEEVLPPAPGIGQQVLDFAKRHWQPALRYASIFAVIMFALFGILRPLARRAGALAQAQPLPASSGAARLPTVSEMEGQMDARLEAARSQQALPALTKRVAKLANEEPEQLARIVRGWMAEEDR